MGAAYAKYTPSYESDYGHVDEYKSNDYKHEAKYPSSYESDNYKHEPSYGSHYEEDYGYEEYTPSHYKSKYSTAPSYKHKPSYDSYSADEDYAREPSYKHQPSYRPKQSVGYGSPYEERPMQLLRHRRSVDPEREGQQSVSVTLVREGQQFFLLPALGAGVASAIGGEAADRLGVVDAFGEGVDELEDFFGGLFSRRSVDSEREGQNLSHMKEQLAKGLMDCPVAEGGEPECGCECSKFWYWQGGEKNGDCNKLSDLGVPFCYLHSPNSCTQAHASSLVPNGKWKHCV